ncbi:uncharacterized protein ARMOST_09901 [Armillaria ostoyae]|uniref:Uncharacterized protein n=1 Tax=Armillaria ostoyae TaxID=47428 RepID=A0A284RCT7_ARMOS|nr:uncharacterized protein ARMOST_09901 [Armillaria ostoyae]
MPAVPIIAGRSADDLDIVFTAVLRSRLGISDRSKFAFTSYLASPLPSPTAKCSLWFDILFYEFAQLAGPVGQTLDEPTSEYLILFRSVYVYRVSSVVPSFLQGN